MKNAFLIVLYKQDIYSSNTLRSYLSINPLNTRLIIWDNSPECLPNEQLDVISKSIVDFSYNSTTCNTSLSKIYNAVLTNNTDCDILYIFDQDSTVTECYFEKVICAYLHNQSIGLFVPYVTVGEVIVSPGNFKKYKGSYWNELVIGAISSKNTLVIASGMALAIQRVLDVGLLFDENLNFYGIDSQFALDYSAKMTFLYVIDYNLKHDLSMFNKENSYKIITRFKNYRYSSLYLLRNRSLKWFIIGYVLMGVKTFLMLMKYPKYSKLLLFDWNNKITGL